MHNQKGGQIRKTGGKDEMKVDRTGRRTENGKMQTETGAEDQGTVLWAIPAGIQGSPCGCVLFLPETIVNYARKLEILRAALASSVNKDLCNLATTCVFETNVVRSRDKRSEHN